MNADGAAGRQLRGAADAGRAGRFTDIDGAAQPYLSDDEVRFLTIRKGSLDEAERLEIESHVTHTHTGSCFRSPGPRSCRRYRSSRYGHHEKASTGRATPKV